MRAAVVGLGDIARKAYLPILASREDLELVLCTRDAGALEALGRRYRVAERTTDVESLPARGVELAFVHTATQAHVAVAERLLRAGVHVYLDKPIAYTLADAERLVEAAEAAERILMVGFNRRFAPMYRALAGRDAALLLMQKNRVRLPDLARRFVFDDFIHVADTLRFLAPGPVRRSRVSSRIRDGLLHHLVLTLEGDGFTALGVMNRDGGAAEETLELAAPGGKWVVRGLESTVHMADGEERVERFADWEPVLLRRGFPQMLQHFTDCVRGAAPAPSPRDALETHALCESIVAELEADGASPWLPGA